MTELLTQPLLFVVVSCLLGLCVGSFLNVVIHRLPKIMELEWQTQAAEIRGEEAPKHETISLSHPRSRCPHCGSPIASWQNVPASLAKAST